MSSNVFVGLLNSTAVRALPIEMFAPAANVLSSHQIAAVVHDRDHAAGSFDPLRLRRGRGDDSTRSFQRQRFLVRDLRRRRRNEYRSDSREGTQRPLDW
jgi:hypothetical protein